MQNSLQQPEIIQIVPKGHLNRPKGAISPDRRSDFIRDMRISLDHRSNIIKGALLFCNAPFSYHLKNIKLQIVRLRDIPEDGMVGRLLAGFYLL